MREPSFWWRETGFAARMLLPIAAIYGAVAAARLRQRGRRAATPVVCIGSPTLGGAGKTPTALAVARLLAGAGERPAFLSRGYGGRLSGPLRVDPAGHAASDVGDEPLLLARAAPTIVARARVAGATMAIDAGASVIVMDDGFQNPSLAKDFSLLVVDARRAVGNGKVVPAGPLRAPLDGQLERADALLVIGRSGGAAGVASRARSRGMPVFQARLEPDSSVVAALMGRRVLAFAGIGDPEKFFATLSGCEIAIADTRSFPDHHRYTEAEARVLRNQADREGLVLVTTEKDLARLGGSRELVQLAAHAHALPVRLVFEDEKSFNELLRSRIAAARQRPHGSGAARAKRLGTTVLDRSSVVWDPGDVAAARLRDWHRLPAGRRSSISIPPAGSARR